MEQTIRYLEDLYSDNQIESFSILGFADGYGIWMYFDLARAWEMYTVVENICAENPGTFVQNDSWKIIS